MNMHPMRCRFLAISIVLLLTTQRMIALSSLTNGLVAFYPFNGSANDATGNGNNGTAQNAILTSDRFGRSGMAYAFNGVDSLIVANVPNIPLGNNARTISLWVKQSSNDASQGVNVLRWGADVPRQAFGIIANSNPYTWQGQSWGGGNDVNSGVVVDKKWHQILVTHDGSALEIWIDGVQKGMSAIGIDTQSSPLAIGGLSGGKIFQGSIDDVRLYNRALSPQEIERLFALESHLSAPIQIEVATVRLKVFAKKSRLYEIQSASLLRDWTPIASFMGDDNFTNMVVEVQPEQKFFRVIQKADLSSGLVAYYPFNGNADDQSDNHNNGIVHGATLALDRAGRPNQSYSFNGVDNYIELPDSPLFDADDYSVSLWFNSTKLPHLGDAFREAAMLLSKGRNHFEVALGTPPLSANGIRFLPRLLDPVTGEGWDATDEVSLNEWHHLVCI